MTRMTPRTFHAWFAAGHLANDWPIAALWIIVPAAGIAMNLSPAEVGLLFTIFNVGGALAYVPAGIIADHVSDQGKILVATFWWVAVGYLVSALAPEFWSLAILLAIAGMGNAAWHPIAAGLLTRESREQRAEALGVHAIGGSLAEVLAPLCIGVLLSYVDWRSALALSVIPTVLLGICFVFVIRAVPRVESTPFRWSDMRGLVDLWRRGAGMRIVAMICLYNMALTALLSMIPLYLVAAHSLAPATVGLVFSALLLAGAIAQPWVGKASDVAGRRPVVVFGNGMAGVACVGLILQPSLGIAIAGMAVAVAALDAIRAAVLAAAVDHSDRQEGTTLGFAFAIMEGIGAFGALLAGIAAGYSWPAMFGLAGALAIGSAALAVSLPRKKATTATASSGCGGVS